MLSLLWGCLPAETGVCMQRNAGVVPLSKQGGLIASLGPDFPEPRMSTVGWERLISQGIPYNHRHPAHSPPPSSTSANRPLSAQNIHSGSSDKGPVFPANVMLSPLPGWKRRGSVPSTPSRPHPCLLEAAEPRAPGFTKAAAVFSRFSCCPWLFFMPQTLRNQAQNPGVPGAVT